MWKSHPINSNYQANEFGEIKSLNYNGKKQEKVLKQTKNTNGYLIVGINGKATLSHRFVWECFNGIIENGMTIDHINTCKIDNNLENLKKCSKKDNNRNELTLKHIKEAAAKYKGKKVLKIDKKTNEIIGWYPSLSEAARKNNTETKYIRWVCNGKTGYNTCVGYKWKYTNDYYTCKWGKWWITEHENNFYDTENEKTSEYFETDETIILWKCKCSIKKYDFLFIPGRNKADVLTRLKNKKENEHNKETIKRIKYAIRHIELWEKCGNIGSTY